ncbi:hypothetical protein ACFC4S_30465 [Priestia megaterium]|uniref:CHASE3 domain-containing protein n=1 Tax=Priestia megaterium TaxID=1404 RepID=UPI001D25193C|nr:hypothetical protein [Priestia megaterium]
MSEKRKLFISLGWSIALALVLAGITYSANKEAVETNKWLEQVKKDVSGGTVHTYKVKQVLSVKNPLTDELDSISTIFFNKKVDKTKIKVIEAFVETKDKKSKTVKIITEVKDSKSISNIKDVSGVLVKGKSKEEEGLIINAKIEQK